jgi:nicotinamidase-related amidase
MDALAMGFGAVLVKDATRAISEEGFRTTEKIIRDRGAMVVFSTEI